MASSPNPGPKLQYVDRPEVSETFVDSLENMQLDGHVLRLEFVVNRVEPPKPPAAPTGKKYTACRLVLPTSELLSLAAKLENMVQALERQGLIQRVPITQTPQGGKPN